jgi:hypothetical protein
MGLSIMLPLPNSPKSESMQAPTPGRSLCGDVLGFPSAPVRKWGEQLRSVDDLRELFHRSVLQRDARGLRFAIL